MSKPAQYGVDIANLPVTFDWVLRNESRELFAGTNITFTPSSGYPAIDGGIAYTDWKTAAAPTIASGKWVQATVLFTPAAGRMAVIFSIKVDVTDACLVAITKNKTTGYMLSGSDLAIRTHDNTYANYIREQPSASGGTVEFIFREPLIVRFGERIALLYYRSGTTGTRWNVSEIMGVDLTNDENYTCPSVYGIIGDSICNVANLREPEYSLREGVKMGKWDIIFQEWMRDNGYETRRVNLGITSTDAIYWEWKCTAGLFRTFRPKVLSVNVGMNDCQDPTVLRTTENADGVYMKCVKNITREYFRHIPNGILLFNQVPDSDFGSRVNTVASGFHAGKTNIQAIRLDLAKAVADLRASNNRIYLSNAANDLPFLASEKDNFLTAEQAAGASLHPNARLGQPKMAAKLIAATGTPFLQQLRQAI